MKLKKSIPAVEVILLYFLGPIKKKTILEFADMFQIVHRVSVNPSPSFPIVIIFSDHGASLSAKTLALWHAAFN